MLPQIVDKEMIDKNGKSEQKDQRKKDFQTFENR